jgi:hypothetical protein
MKYNIDTGIKNVKAKAQRILLGSLVTVFSAGLVVSGGSALAANDYCGASANGCAHSMSNTQCAGHGAFGAFGKDNNFAGGASGDRTAYANSTLCGNPSPNSAAATLGDTPH